MLAGQVQNQAFYALRPGLGLLAYALFFLPVWSATNLVIAGMAMLSAGAMYLIGRRYALPRVFSALLGASTYLLGSISFHLADYSAHVAGPATWIVASLVVSLLLPWERDAGWRRFFLAHLTFWIIVPFYWSNIILYVALVSMFLLQLRKLTISLALLVGCYFWREAWAFAMNYAYGGSVAYGLTESEYLTRAMNAWLDHIRSGDFLHVARQALHYALQSISPEPIVVIVTLGVMAFAALRSKSLSTAIRDRFLIFTLLSGAGACALVVIWGPSANARGYLAYGVPIALLISMIVIVGRSDLSRSDIRGVSLAMAVLVCLQLTWVKSLMIGNPMPVCQYFLAGHDMAGVFPAFVKSLLNPLTFLPFGADLQLHGLVQMNAVIADALSALTPTLMPFTTGAVDTSRKLLPSLTLGGVLLLPLAIALVVGMRRPIEVRRVSWRSGIPAAASLPLLWLVSWGVAPHVRSGGLAYYNLHAACPENGLTRQYAITIPSGFEAVLQRHHIERVELLGGFRRLHESDLISVDVSKDGDATSSLVSSDGKLPVELFKGLLSPNGATTKLLLSEHFRIPPVRYVGWRHQVSGVEGCAGSNLAPFVELRGYKGGRPTLFTY